MDEKILVTIQDLKEIFQFGMDYEKEVNLFDKNELSESEFLSCDFNELMLIKFNIKL